jgi:hypothetical protein
LLAVAAKCSQFARDLQRTHERPPGPSPSRSDEGWSRSGESSSGSVSSGWGSLGGGEFWEPKVGLKILSSGLSQHIVWMLDNSLDNVDVFSSGTVSSGHLAVHLRDGTAESGGSVFLVHVDNIGSSLVLKNNADVFDG